MIRHGHVKLTANHICSFHGADEMKHTINRQRINQIMEQVLRTWRRQHRAHEAYAISHLLAAVIEREYMMMRRATTKW